MEACFLTTRDLVVTAPYRHHERGVSRSLPNSWPLGLENAAFAVWATSAWPPKLSKRMPEPLMGVPRISGMELSLRELQQHQEKRHGWRAESILCREDCIFFHIKFCDKSPHDDFWGTPCDIQPQEKLADIQPQRKLADVQPQGKLTDIQPQGKLTGVQSQGRLTDVQPQGELADI